MHPLLHYVHFRIIKGREFLWGLIMVCNTQGFNKKSWFMTSCTAKTHGCRKTIFTSYISDQPAFQWPIRKASYAISALYQPPVSTLYKTVLYDLSAQKFETNTYWRISMIIYFTFFLRKMGNTLEFLDRSRRPEENINRLSSKFPHCSLQKLQFSSL